jgi:hypothetical protein
MGLLFIEEWTHASVRKEKAMLKQILLSLAFLGATSVFATEGVSEMAEQLFGKEEAGKRVSEGVVFIDGQYVRAPYAVTREGNVILVNGRIASRFKVESSAAKEEPPPAEDDGASTGYVSEEEGADIGSDATPTLDDVPEAPKEAPKKTSTIEAKLAKKGGGSIEERLAAKQKAKNLKNASSKGSFNTEPESKDPMALFEEADYTYTPPLKPEPPAVPYVRPAAQKSMTERMAEARKKDPTAAKKPEEVAEATAEAAGGEAEGGEDVVAVESFEDLTEEEIADYTKRFTERRAAIEKALAADGMVFLSSASSGMKVTKRKDAQRFLEQFEELCKAKSSAKLIEKWGRSLPRAYLQRIFDNRTENLKNMKSLFMRMKREAKSNKGRSKPRL